MFQKIQNVKLVLVAVFILMFAAQPTAALDLSKSKVKIDNLVDQIEYETGERLMLHLNNGEILPINNLQEEIPPIISLQDNALFFGVDNCDDLSEFKNWSILAYPLKVNTDSSVDIKRPTINLKFTLLKNATLIQSELTSQCFSHVNFNRDELFKVDISKSVMGKRQWDSKKAFAEEVDYLAINRPSSKASVVPSRSILCNEAARQCYRNSSKMPYDSHLTTLGPESVKSSDTKEIFYLQSRNTYDELVAKYTKFELEELVPVKSEIAGFISKNLQHVIIVSVRDNAMGRLKASDLVELKDLGVDLTSLGIRGAHISILQPGKTAINKTDNNGAITLLPAEHGVANLGRVSSAGFTSGDNSLIEVFGRNESTNFRGINVVVMTAEGKILRSKNFDTHIAPHRSQGIFKAQVK